MVKKRDTISDASYGKYGIKTIQGKDIRNQLQERMFL